MYEVSASASMNCLHINSSPITSDVTPVTAYLGGFDLFMVHKVGTIIMVDLEVNRGRMNINLQHQEKNSI